MYPAGSTLPLALLFATLLKPCTPEVYEDEEPIAEVAEPSEPTPEPTPPPLAAAELLPFAADDPRAAAAASLRDALAATEQADWPGVLAALDGSAGFEPGLEAWTRGRALWALDRKDEADAAWAAVPAGSRWRTEALLRRASRALEAGRPEAVAELLGPIRSDQFGADAPRADALRMRARQALGDVPGAHAAALSLWTSGRGGEADSEAEAALEALSPQVPAEQRATFAHRVRRAAALGSGGAKQAVLDLLEPEAAALSAADLDPELACLGLFHLGRARYRVKRYTDSVAPLAAAADRCVDDHRPRARYLLGLAQTKTDQDADALLTWRALADGDPEHRLADDALYHAGSARLDAGDPAGAQTFFEEMVRRFPDGDMVARGLWAVAWSALEQGDGDGARPWLEAMAQGDTGTAARKRVLQGRYWSARVDLDSPERAADARRRLAELAVAEPLSWYGTLALWRLGQEDPAAATAAASEARARLDALATGPELPATFDLEPALRDDPHLQLALLLHRGGLHGEAREELLLALGDSPHETRSDAALVLAAHLLSAAGDPHRSHNLFRFRFREAFPPLLPERRPELLAAWPPAFHDNIVKACAAYGWTPWIFEGLVREESAFSPEVKSWAGAMGLSQLMWPTASQTARRMGIKNLTRQDLGDPDTNLAIGSRYFDGLMQRWKGHLPLAIGSYNAGPGAMGRWVDERGELPLDAFVETIPYNETRDYVKRVTASFQAYHALYGAGVPFVPLRVGKVIDGIAGRDPELTLPPR